MVYSSTYHVVRCPKYRRKALTGAVDARLQEILRDLCREMRAEVIALEVMHEHAQLLVEADPQSGVHRLVKRLKGTSSRYLRQEFPPLKSRLPTLWTNSYFVSTVGDPPLAVIQQYVEQQKNV